MARPASAKSAMKGGKAKLTTPLPSVLKSEEQAREYITQLRSAVDPLAKAEVRRRYALVVQKAS